MASFHAQRLSVGKGGWFSPRSSCSHSPPAPASGALLPGEGTGTFPFREVNPSERESVAACRVPYGDPPSGKTSAWHQSETSVVFPSPHPVANTDSVIKDKNPDAAQMSSTESAPSSFLFTSPSSPPRPPPAGDPFHPHNPRSGLSI